MGKYKYVVVGLTISPFSINVIKMWNVGILWTLASCIIDHGHMIIFEHTFLCYRNTPLINMHFDTCHDIRGLWMHT